MGLLVGLPLKLFHIAFVVLRLVWPVLLVLLVLWLVKRRRRPGGSQKTKEPDFDGPVYTVDYEDVSDKEE